MAANTKTESPRRAGDGDDERFRVWLGNDHQSDYTPDERIPGETLLEQVERHEREIIRLDVIITDIGLRRRPGGARPVA